MEKLITIVTSAMPIAEKAFHLYGSSGWSSGFHGTRSDWVGVVDRVLNECALP